VFSTVRFCRDHSRHDRLGPKVRVRVRVRVRARVRVRVWVRVWVRFKVKVRVRRSVRVSYVRVRVSVRVKCRARVRVRPANADFRHAFDGNPVAYHAFHGVIRHLGLESVLRIRVGLRTRVEG
jgi:hypothetical protein